MGYSALQTGDRYRRYRRPHRMRKIVLLAVIVAVVIFTVVWARCNVTNLLISVSEEDVRARTAAAVNDVALRTMSRNAVDLKNLVQISRDSNGNIVSIESDTHAMNVLARQTQSLASEEVERVCAEGIQVPLGAFFGLDILSGVGPKITFRVLPIGTVSCVFYSDFEQAGINQTKHSLMLRAETKVDIILPGEKREVAVETQILLCENIIVGKVPEIYLNGGKLG